MQLDKRTLLTAIGAVVAGGGIATVGASQTNLMDDEDVSPSEVSLSEEEARDIATDEVAGTVRESELEGEEDGPVYEFDIETPDGVLKEVEVHANTGEVLEVEREDEDDDADGTGDDDDDGNEDDDGADDDDN